MAAGLRLELFGAPDVSVRQAPIAGADAEAGLEIGDVGIALNRWAVVFPGVAIEEEIARDGAALHAGEDRPREAPAFEVFDAGE